MKITALLKAWLVAQKGLSADMTDDEAREATAKALADGSLDATKFVELQQDESTAAAQKLFDRLDQIESGVQSRIEEMKKEFEGKLEAAGEAKEVVAEQKETTAEVKEEVVAQAKSATAKALDRMFSDPMEAEDAKAAGTVRVKGAHEQYDGTKSAARYPEQTEKGTRHPYAGQLVKEGDRQVFEASELEKAIAGAFVKFAMASGTKGAQLPRVLRMTDHDRQLMAYALENSKWGGVIGGVGSETDGAQGIKGATLSHSQQKAVLDDATSGGLEAAPIAFDDQVILTPLLYGEFANAVNMVPITRGRRIEGVSIGNVTISSGGADGTAIPLFNTSNFISAFDTNIYVANGSIEIGLDFLSDSPVDLASIVTETYGRQLLTWLDTQITTGDGTTEPEGIMNASGTTSVSADNGNTGPPTVGDYESLLFGVSKAYKQGYATNRIRFGGNETTYSRARGIAVGASDQRRVFGMNQEDYMLFGHPYGITESMTNTQVFFGNLARYRLYRRLGLQVKVTTEGKELVRDNMMLISARARFGGQIEDGSAFAVTTNAQS